MRKPSEGAVAATGTAEQTSSEYWRSMEGGLYEEMIREREGYANRSYQQQEGFLTRFVQAERDRLGRPIRILEFGCGFGRHARYLADLEGVSYAGYDFSEKMVEPLRARPPQGVLPLSEHVFTGPDVAQAVGARRFDLVFTVSVLIHNPPEKVPGLIETMANMLAPGGAICLIENQLVPLSVFENLWHEGCWLQSYTQHVQTGYDVQIGQGIVDTHDVYVLRPNGGGPAKFFRLQDGGDLSRTELDAMSVRKISAWARSAEKVIARGDGAVAEDRLFEAQEMIRAERRRAQARYSLWAVADDLVNLRARRAEETKVKQKSLPPSPEAVEKPPLQWDEPLDVRWAQGDGRFSRVLHIFHQEWHGIRASAGYTPGHKLALTSKRLLSAAEHARITAGIEARFIRTVVFHGYSDTADELMGLLRKVPGLSLHLVWHGNTAQFHVDFEYEMFRRLLKRRKDGVLDGLACVKADMHLISDRIFGKTLLSLPPRMEEVPPRTGLSGRAFIPVPNDWRKNFYTNLLAAHEVERIREVLVTTDFTPFPGDEKDRVIRVRHPDRAQVFRVMRDSDVILNATLSECQPMTALEGLSLGTPCLTGPLGLQDLDRHPYQQLTQVRAVDSVRDLRDAIERILDLRDRSPRELREMREEYSRVLCAEAIARYCEFLRL